MKRRAGKIWMPIMISVCLILLKSQDCPAFRCGNGLVTEGDTKAKVLIECGKPTYKEKTSGKQKKIKTTSTKSRIVEGVSPQKKYQNRSRSVEKWYYNCGNNDFIYVLEFENGILQKEDTVGRGKGKSDCMGK